MSDQRMSGVSRRAVLGGGVAASLGAPMVAHAQQPITLRWWSPQTAPAQREAYRFQIATFEAANPGVRVVFEPSATRAIPRSSPRPSPRARCRAS